MRESISKKVRFEVLKRDGHKCQYCGLGAPDVALVIDHIHPVSMGGKNDILNLITSCQPCNAGKSDRLLNDKTFIEKTEKSIEDLKSNLASRVEQLEKVEEWRSKFATVTEKEIEKVQDLLGDLPCENREVKRLIQKYGLKNVCESAIRAEEKYHKYPWKFRGKLETYCQVTNDPNLGHALYVRTVLYNRFEIERDRMKSILEALKWGFSIGVCPEKAKENSKKASSWNDFVNIWNELTEKASSNQSILIATEKYILDRLQNSSNLLNRHQNSL